MTHSPRTPSGLRAAAASNVALSLLEVDEAQPYDGKQHEGKHEAYEDGNDLASEVPLVVEIGGKIVLEGQQLASGGGKGVLKVTQLKHNDGVERPGDGVKVVIPHPPSRHSLQIMPRQLSCRVPSQVSTGLVALERCSSTNHGLIVMCILGCFGFADPEALPVMV